MEVTTMFEGLFQPMHLVVILIIAILVFGPKKLPEIGKGLGDGIRAFKDSIRDKGDDVDPGSHDPGDKT
jgi:sec-independent protein translocase protein TatA